MTHMTEGTNISLEIYRKVVEAEIQALRSENLNLKVVIAQLQEDNKELGETLKMAQSIKRNTNDESRVVSLDSRMADRVKTGKE